MLNLDLRATQRAAISLYEGLGYQRWGTHPVYARVEGEIVPGHYYYKRARRARHGAVILFPGDRSQGRRLRAPGARRDGERDRVQRRPGGAGARLRRSRLSTGCMSSISTAPSPARSVNGDGGAGDPRAVDAARSQLGGGIRDRGAIDAWLDPGIDRVVLGTAALRDPELVRTAAARHPGPHRRRHRCARRPGRGRRLGRDQRDAALDLARRFEDAGVAAIVYTDIDRDGAMGGIDAEATAGLARRSRHPGDRLGRRRLARRHRRAEGARDGRHRRRDLRPRAL